MDSSMNIDSLKTYALPIAAAIVVVAAVPLAIMPWFEDITSNWSEIAVESDRRDLLKAKADKLESFNVASNKKLLEDTVLPAIPAEIDPAGLLGTVEQVARQAEVTISGVSYTDAASANTTVVPVEGEESAVVDNTQYVSVTVTVEGSYEQIASFIARSENVSRVYTLDTLHIVRGTEGLPNVASFDVRAPYVPHPTSLALEDPFEELTAKRSAIVDRLKSYSEINYAPTDVSNITGKANPF